MGEREELLQVGDVVSWRGGWGSDSARPARVVGMEVCLSPGDKTGVAVVALPWWAVRALGNRGVMVDLDNGHWAWGFQVEPREVVTMEI